MSEVVEAYSAPDGEIDEENVAELGESLVAVVEAERQRSLTQVVDEVVSRLEQAGGGQAPTSEPPTAGPQSVDGKTLDVAAVAVVHYTCRGWDEASPAAAANGLVELTATLDRGGLIPTVWGGFRRCRFVRGDYQVEVDGTISIRFGQTQPRVGLRYLRSLGYTVAFDLNATTQGSGEPIDVSIQSTFQILRGDVRFLITLADGRSVVGFFDLTTLNPALGETAVQGGVITADGTWRCTINVLNRSGTCFNVADPSTVVSW